MPRATKPAKKKAVRKPAKPPVSETSGNVMRPSSGVHVRVTALTFALQSLTERRECGVKNGSDLDPYKLLERAAMIEDYIQYGAVPVEPDNCNAPVVDIIID